MEDAPLLLFKGITAALVISGIGAFIKWRQDKAQDDADEVKYGYRKKKNPNGGIERGWRPTAIP